jgi:hypothetical protein
MIADVGKTGASLRRSAKDCKMMQEGGKRGRIRRSSQVSQGGGRATPEVSPDRWLESRTALQAGKSA